MAVVVYVVNLPSINGVFIATCSRVDIGMIPSIDSLVAKLDFRACPLDILEHQSTV
jgi:hypothetical protein